MLTATERKLRARLGAHAQHAKHDARLTTLAGRESFLSQFERQVDPEGLLPPDERARRAEHARRAHFLDLSLKSAKARRERKESKAAGPLKRKRRQRKDEARTGQASGLGEQGGER